MAAHALKGVAETCCAASLTDACWELENFAAGFKGFNASEPPKKGQPALMQPGFRSATLGLLQRIEQRAAEVVDKMGILAGMSDRDRTAELAAVDGFIELVEVSVRPLSSKHSVFIS